MVVHCDGSLLLTKKGRRPAAKKSLYRGCAKTLFRASLKFSATAALSAVPQARRHLILAFRQLVHLVGAASARNTVTLTPSYQHAWPSMAGINADDVAGVQPELNANERRRQIDSESGTEADDEHHRLGRPSSKLKQGGVRGIERALSASDADGADGNSAVSAPLLVDTTASMRNGAPRKAVFSGKSRIELLRRVLEVLLLLGLGHIIRSGDGQNTGTIWARGESELIPEQTCTDQCQSLRLKPRSSSH